MGCRYYDIIKKPFALEMIEDNIANDVYTTFDQCYQDFLLIWKNACQFNNNDSFVHEDAVLLREVCIQNKRRLQARYITGLKF